ncbi:MAG TPA: hypothetical protein VE967_09030 [Gemmatimonadaceae bacterium]|nr:hypothetical protein [Gemmatimonadaceae bacterium]
MSKKSRPDVDHLLAERARFEAWLDQLAAKASTMPPHVVARVRADYEGRLTKVVDELQSRADALRADVATLEQQIADLDADLGGRRDARAEDELRAAVGEFDEDAWRAKSTEHDTGIDAAESQRAARSEELARVLEMLAEATRPARADAADAPGAAMEPAAGAVPGAAPADAGPEEPAPALPTTKSPSPFDEIGFLRTVVGRSTPFPGVTSPDEGGEAPARSSGSEPAKRATPAESTPATAARVFERPSIPNAEQPLAAAAPPAEVRVSGSGRLSGASAAQPAAQTSAEGTRASGSVDRRSGNVEASRSLKCQECGSMNYPTEWYCEKCGGELAAF